MSKAPALFNRTPTRSSEPRPQEDTGKSSFSMTRSGIPEAGPASMDTLSSMME